MYAKSFVAVDGNGRLTGARKAQTAPYDHYRCHLCSSSQQYHPEYDTERPWFEHTANSLTENGKHDCPYVQPKATEMRLISRLRRFPVRGQIKLTGTVRNALAITMVNAIA